MSDWINFEEHVEIDFLSISIRKTDMPRDVKILSQRAKNSLYSLFKLIVVGSTGDSKTAVI